MRKYLFAIILLVVATSSFGKPQRIAAIVNDQLITMLDFQARKKMIRLFNKIGALNLEQEKSLNKAVLDTLIEEEILFGQADHMGIKISDEELNASIASIEQRNKMGTGALAAQLRNGGVDPETFRSKIKAELIKNQIVSGTVARGLSVSPSEIEAAVLDSNIKDALIEMKVFTASNNSQKTYESMLSLIKKLPDSCSKLMDKKFKGVADISDSTAKLSQLQPQMQTFVKDLAVGEHSEIIKIGDEYKVFMICAKKIENFSEDETNNIINFIGNKKVFLKSQKYMENLRNRAYVKIMM